MVAGRGATERAGVPARPPLRRLRCPVTVAVALNLPGRGPGALCRSRSGINRGLCEPAPPSPWITSAQPPPTGAPSPSLDPATKSLLKLTPILLPLTPPSEGSSVNREESGRMCSPAWRWPSDLAQPRGASPRSVLAPRRLAACLSQSLHGQRALSASSC
ncbi:hypothetical protein SKAU_G00125420 [Synaphobranchus kaupii]|uniref:Uncharacterized protein n=1 Tax=Synaphobranchus kaupii TaxID=118154 RepID=A0A9Q1J2G1_SYNKA|nr:hypothetical protein SKAU_G00125420 [Synaphobranchus kaupii]